MEEIFPTIYSVPFFNEQCFLDYTTGVFGAHISQTRERAARYCFLALRRESFVRRAVLRSAALQTDP
jgi:hypothetical protein